MNDIIIAGEAPVGLNAGREAIAKQPIVGRHLDTELADHARLASDAGGAHAAHMGARSRYDAVKSARDSEVDAGGGRLSSAREEYWTQQIAAAKADLDRAAQNNTATNVQMGQQGQHVEAMIAHLNLLGAQDAEVKLAKLPDLSRQKLSGLIDLIDEKAGEAANLGAQRKDIESRPKPPADYLAKAKGEVDRLFDTPMVQMNWTDKGSAVKFATVSIDAAPAHHDATPRAPDLRPAIVRLARDQIMAEVEKQIYAHYRNLPPPMSASDKAKALAKLDRDSLAAELVEVAAIRAARALGHRIAYRRGVDPRALLQLDGGPKPAPRQR